VTIALWTTKWLLRKAELREAAVQNMQTGRCETVAVRLTCSFDHPRQLFHWTFAKECSGGLPQRKRHP
jgi:hypothetical protein